MEWDELAWWEKSALDRLGDIADAMDERREQLERLEWEGMESYTR